MTLPKLSQAKAPWRQAGKCTVVTKPVLRFSQLDQTSNSLLPDSRSLTSLS